MCVYGQVCVCVCVYLSALDPLWITSKSSLLGWVNSINSVNSVNRVCRCVPLCIGPLVDHEQVVVDRVG